MNKKRNGLTSFRKVDVGLIFDTTKVDDTLVYTMKRELYNLDKWYHTEVLKRLYKYNSIKLHFNFRSSSVPARCENKITSLTKELVLYLRNFLSRVSEFKCKLIVTHFIKHISRMKYHNKFSITYSKKRASWKADKRLSSEYMNHLVDLLSDQGNVYHFNGFKSTEGNILSMLIVSPTFIDECLSTVNDDGVMDDCLREHFGEYIIIRDADKNVRLPKREEIAQMNVLSEVYKNYHKLIERSTITINGICIPEIFFRRIGFCGLELGLRGYDDGAIQGQDAVSRSSITIDGEPTIELDYSALHYRLAAEQEGIVLGGNEDPYDFDIDVDVDWEEVNKWKTDYGFNKEYDPVRNLKKTVMLIMFNASSLESARKAIVNAVFKDKSKNEQVKRKFVGLKEIPAKELINKTLEHNNRVEKYFLSGVGLAFQKKDSDMMAYCIEMFVATGEICIPIHDSLIVKESLKDYTKVVMEDAYEHVMGSKLNCKIK